MADSQQNKITILGRIKFLIKKSIFLNERRKEKWILTLEKAPLPILLKIESLLQNSNTLFTDKLKINASKNYLKKLLRIENFIKREVLKSNTQKNIFKIY